MRPSTRRRRRIAAPVQASPASMRSAPSWTIDAAPAPVVGTATAVTVSTSLCTVDDALAYAALPAYTAVSSCEPAAKAAVKVAVAAPTAVSGCVPGESNGPSACSGAVPSRVVPSKNCTLPLGVCVLGASGVTVALSVTVSPATAGFGEDDKVTATAPCATVSVAGDDVLVA